jgi:hypothetical protein
MEINGDLIRLLSKIELIKTIAYEYKDFFPDNEEERK